VVGGTAFFLVVFFTALMGGQQFQVPGAQDLKVGKPGTYVIWYDYATFYEGRSYQLGDELPNGLVIRVTEKASGQAIPVEQDLGSRETVGELRRRSIAVFKAPRTGSYSIEVSGSFEPRVFRVRRSVTVRIILASAVLALANLVGWFGGLSIAIVTFLARRRAGASW
jgi:hypothetical protein